MAQQDSLSLGLQVRDLSGAGLGRDVNITPGGYSLEADGQELSHKVGPFTHRDGDSCKPVRGEKREGGSPCGSLMDLSRLSACVSSDSQTSSQTRWSGSLPHLLVSPSNIPPVLPGWHTGLD